MKTALREQYIAGCIIAILSWQCTSVSGHSSAERWWKYEEKIISKMSILPSIICNFEQYTLRFFMLGKTNLYMCKKSWTDSYL